jgi:hypothetical protein
MRIIAVGTTLLVLATTSLSAQKSEENRNPRQGFWIGFGLGEGSTGADCSSCDNSRTTGLSGYLRMGGTLSQSVLIGGETNGWTHSKNSVDEAMGFASAVLIWYPSRTGAFYLKFGLGVMRYTADDGVDKLEANAAAGSLGLGYEFRASRNMSVNVFLNSLASAPASFKFDGVSAPSGEDIKLNLVQFGVGLTWH